MTTVLISNLSLIVKYLGPKCTDLQFQLGSELPVGTGPQSIGGWSLRVAVETVRNRSEGTSYVLWRIIVSVLDTLWMSYVWPTLPYYIGTSLKVEAHLALLRK